MNNCIFCNIPDERILFENNLSFAIRDNFPVSDGHILIIPKRHFSDFFDINDNELIACKELILKSKKYIDKKFNPDGYNIGINVGEYGGQSVFHLHIHIIPRYKGDIKNPRGGVRGVIPHKRCY